MLKYYTLYFLCFLVLPFFVSAQYPTAPNEKDIQGVRIGRWTILFDKDFKPTEQKDSAQYFRVITYNKGIPSGRVYDYYLSGALQAESNLLSDQPADVYDGAVLIYYEKGNLKYKFQFNFRNLCFTIFHVLSMLKKFSFFPEIPCFPCEQTLNLVHL